MKSARDWKSVPVPEALALRPKDKRGFPIPYTASIDRNGEPHFTVIDQRAAYECASTGKCQLCGQKLEQGPNGGAWLIGGPICFSSPHGAFLDPPMHKQCAEYAVRVCPYIAAPRFRESEAFEAKAREALAGDAVVHVSEHAMEGRPEVFALGQCASYQVMPTPDGFVVHNPGQRWVRLFLYRHGVEITDPEEQRALLELDGKRRES